MQNEIDLERATRLLENIEQDLRSLKQVLGTSSYAPEPAYFSAEQANEQAIEGVFDGEKMLDFQGKSYQISANYASKSKLVEGDPLKLYITRDGKFFYKQLGPVERKTMEGAVRAEGNHYVIDGEDGVTYNILTASVTYYISMFNLQIGDKVTIMIPADREAHWAVIDNVL